MADYDSLHNATFVSGQSMTLTAGHTRTLPVPASAGGALDIAVSFDLGPLAGSATGFGIAVRAPQSSATASGGIELSFSVSAPDAVGARVVTAAQGTGPLRPSPPPFAALDRQERGLAVHERH